MLKIELNNPNGFISIFKSLEYILDEIRIECDEQGIKITGLDASHITFVNLELKPEYFDSYSCEGIEYLNIRADELNRILSVIDNNDFLTIKNNEKELILTFEGEMKRTFKIRLISMEYESPKPPNLEYPSTIELSFDLLKKEMNNSFKFADNVKLGVNENCFTMNWETNCAGMDMEYLHGEKVEGEYCSYFSIDKLRDCLKADKFSDVATINLGNDMPLSLIIEDINKHGKLSFLIAPRVEAD
jgi:proliferating cell nuclear antigen